MRKLRKVIKPDPPTKTVRINDVPSEIANEFRILTRISDETPSQLLEKWVRAEKNALCGEGSFEDSLRRYWSDQNATRRVYEEYQNQIDNE